MNCPGCGCIRIKYRQEAGYKKFPKDKAWERTDHVAKCPKCKHLFNMETMEEVKEEKKNG